jgi:PEP-CTERM motif
MRAIIVLLAALCANLFGATASFANVTYILNLFFPVEDIGIFGSITTDGKMGVLSASDIVGYDFFAGGPLFGIGGVNPQDFTLSLIGDDLVATGRDLTFAYGANDGGIFSFQQKFVHPGTLFYCNATGGQDACIQGISLFGFPPYEASVNLTEALVLGVVPEPATWVMMLLGFAGLGFVGYRQARKG